MENILENNDYDSDLNRSYSENIKKERSSDREIFGPNEDSDADDNQDHDQDCQDQEIGEAIEANLIKDEKLKDEYTTMKNERKDSISFGDDIIFPEMRRNSDKDRERDRERQKRKELRSKRELEEEEREKMQ